MNKDSYTEVINQSWSGRVGKSIKGVIFGVIFFIAALPLLWWNEGRSVETYQSLNEGQQAVVSVASDRVNPDNDGKLIHVQGMADTQEVLHDDILPIMEPAIRLQRQVMMYQWQETEESQTQEKIGGGNTTTKTYTYSKDWSDSEINAEHFKQPQGHENPSMPFKKNTVFAKAVHIGGFELNADQISHISGKQSLNVQAIEAPAQLMGKKLTNRGSEFYLGEDLTTPQIGDLKISFQVVKPANISIVAVQQGNSFNAYQTKAGRQIDLLEMGLKDADAMFAEAQSDNVMLTWLVRMGGFIFMWLGLFMVLKPLSILASVLPFLGRLIAMGSGVIALLLALPFTMLTIALAWIAYRPILAVSLIAIAGAIMFGMKYMPRRDVYPTTP